MRTFNIKLGRTTRSVLKERDASDALVLSALCRRNAAAAAAAAAWKTYSTGCGDSEMMLFGVGATTTDHSLA